MTTKIKIYKDSIILFKMATQLIQMKGEEFVKKVLDGERDFSGIELEEGFRLSDYDGFKKMQEYLKSQDLKRSPVNIIGSSFKYLKAIGLYLPFLNGGRADLERADLGGANLEEAYLGRADLRRADLRRANLERADFGGAYLGLAHLGGANLRGADFKRANLGGADFGGAYLRNAKNLEYAICLGYAQFIGTKVTKKEEEIIQSALDRIERFVVG